MRYLNHAGTSWPKPTEVAVAATPQAPSLWPSVFEQAHGAVAGHFGVAAESMLLAPSATSALAVAVGDIPWTGGRALTSSMEHHALMRPLLAAPVDVVKIPRTVDAVFDLSAFERELLQGDVQLVAVSAVANTTGEALPLKQIIAAAHEAGALVLVDGAQAAGWMELDLDQLEVDLFCFASHKGPQAPYGIGGLYVRPGVMLNSPPAVCDTEVCRPGPSWCDVGSVNLPALQGLAAGLAWMVEHRPLASALALARTLRIELGRRSSIRVLGGQPAVPTVAFVVKDRPVHEVGRIFRQSGLVIGAGVHCAPAAHEALGVVASLRVSFGPLSTEADVAAVLQVLDDQLHASATGQRD